MNKFLRPDLVCKSIYDIDFAEFRKRNIKGLFFDIDNTLETFGSDTPSAKIMTFFEKLKADGFKLGIISNAGGGRSQRYAEKAGLFFCGRANKPRIKMYRKTAEEMGLSNFETAMIGDQIFTDIKGANKFGAYTVLVKPIDLTTEPWYTAIKRRPEKYCLKRMGIAW